MRRTPNLGLKLPDGVDRPDVEDLNYNSEKLDDVIKANDDAINARVDGKQDTLTWDNEPTKNSMNPVRSGGLLDFLNGYVEEINENIFDVYGYHGKIVGVDLNEDTGEIVSFDDDGIITEAGKYLILIFVTKKVSPHNSSWGTVPGSSDSGLRQRDYGFTRLVRGVQQQGTTSTAGINGGSGEEVSPIVMIVDNGILTASTLRSGDAGVASNPTTSPTGVSNSSVSCSLLRYTHVDETDYPPVLKDYDCRREIKLIQGTGVGSEYTYKGYKILLREGE